MKRRDVTFGCRDGMQVRFLQEKRVNGMRFRWNHSTESLLLLLSISLRYSLALRFILASDDYDFM